ncbi:PREDICTED: uncharacterized protein YpeP-like [Prunus mume]|uniref:Uncharacterized protein YpeP-like n=1 Tax=Prunus mume TaxID=102107 RepID=A0ABM1LUH2_PRUMU|nr:PREDICTED: uncharacterized protein YpeP-like [Prunus mume]
MEVYVDDMLVKSHTANQHIPNLSAMFAILKQYRMRLNPTKCAFGVASGKFLGFMISQRGIEANPEKIQTILDMMIPKTVKDIQSFTGRVAALTRFIYKATDRRPILQGCGAGLVLISPDKVVLEYALHFKFHASNNEAEYEALLAGLRLAKEMGAKQVQIFIDSQLVVHQVNQDFTAKDISMTMYLQHTRHLLETFDTHLMSQVPRSENSHVDALARLASELEQGICRNIHIEFLDQPSTRAPLICVIDHSLTWMNPIT